MKKLYNVFIAVLAIVSIVFVILDLCSIISFAVQPYKAIDTVILIIFAIDYIVRFALSKNRGKFFKSNIFDLIAIIPFNSIFAAFRAFRLFRILRFTKLAKISRLVRAAAFFGVLKERIGEILRTNGFLYVLYANIVLISISSIIMTYAEKQPFSDALWWSIVTCTTVGYGDIAPTTTIGRVIAVLLMVFGIGLIGMLTGAITTYFTTNHNKNDDDNIKELNDIILNMDNANREKLIEIAKILAK